MKLGIYVILSPDQPDRAYVSTSPPSLSRARSLRESGSEIWRVTAEIPTEFPLNGRVAAPAKKLRFLGETVVNRNGLKGSVVAEDDKSVIVQWNHSRGTFSVEAFEDGSLTVIT